MSFPLAPQVSPGGGSFGFPYDRPTNHPDPVPLRASDANVLSVGKQSVLLSSSDEGPRNSFPTVNMDYFVTTRKRVNGQYVSTTNKAQVGHMCLIDTRDHIKTQKMFLPVINQSSREVVATCYNLPMPTTLDLTKQQVVYHPDPTMVDQFSLKFDEFSFGGIINNEPPKDNNPCSLVNFYVSRYALVRNYWYMFNQLVPGTSLFLAFYNLVAEDRNSIRVMPWAISGCSVPIYYYNWLQHRDTPDKVRENIVNALFDKTNVSKLWLMPIANVLVCPANVKESIVQIDMCTRFEISRFF